MSAEPLTTNAAAPLGQEAPPVEEELRQRAERVDRALTRVESMEPGPRAHALELKGAIEAFHKAGLSIIVRTLKADPRGLELLFALVDDPEVYSLFTLHGLVRGDLRAKVLRILDDFARPYLNSHGGDVELVEVRERVVTVRLTGACNGCSMSSVTLRNSVEETLRTHAPEIERVETAPAEPAAEPGFVPLAALGKGGTARGWIEGPELAALEEGRAYRLEVPGDAETTVLLLRLDGEVKAFRNACAHQGLPLDGGLVDREEGTIACPWHGFRFDARTGECLTAPQAQLEPFPLRVENGRIRVRPE